VLLDNLLDRSIQEGLTTDSALRRCMGRGTGLVVLAASACCSPLRCTYMYMYMMRRLPLRTRTQQAELRPSLSPHAPTQLLLTPVALPTCTSCHHHSRPPPPTCPSTSCGMRGCIWAMRNAGKRKRRLEPPLPGAYFTSNIRDAPSCTGVARS
jgi:hypothetical protein